MTARRRSAGDQGSALMLMPAAVLVVLVLAAITVDLSVVHLTTQRLRAAAATAADDAAAAAVDEEAMLAGDGVHLDADRARQAALDSLRIQGVAGEIDTVQVTLGSTGVTVTVTGEAHYLFATAIPGAHDHATVTADAAAAPVVR